MSLWVSVIEPFMHNGHTRTWTHFVVLCSSLPSTCVTIVGGETLKSRCCYATAVTTVTIRSVSCLHFWKFLKVRSFKFFKNVCKFI